MAPAAPLPRLLFVHGMWSSAAVWEAWRPRFEARGFATEAPSLPGHGGDSDRLDGLGLEDCALAVEQAIERAPGPVALIGHSMGGLLCQQVAARRPLAALVLVCSAAPAPVFRSGRRCGRRCCTTSCAGTRGAASSGCRAAKPMRCC